MALLHFFKGSIYKSGADIFKQCTVFVHSSSGSDDVLNDIQNLRKDEDMPVEMENPFTKDKPQCILCKYDIEPNFRNVRLLSQFMSTYTGRVYGRHITGLCEYKHKLVKKEIEKAQKSGLLGYYSKDPNFLADPDLYNPFQPFRVM